MLYFLQSYVPSTHLLPMFLEVWGFIFFKKWAFQYLLKNPNFISCYFQEVLSSVPKFCFPFDVERYVPQLSIHSKLNLVQLQGKI